MTTNNQARESKVERLKSVNKAIAALNCFNLKNVELTTSEISKMLGLHRVTVYRLLETLTKANFLEKNETTGKYSIGPTLYSLGILFLSTKDLIKEAKPVTKALNGMTGEVVNIGILRKGYETNILREESKHTLRFSYHVGSSWPAHATSVGKALISELSDEEIDEIYPEEKLEPLASKTIATKTELKRQLERIKETGGAIAKEESREGVWAVGSVIRDSNGRSAAALSISAPSIRMDEKRLELFVELVKLGARLISYRLGYQDLSKSIINLEDIFFWWNQNGVETINEAESPSVSIE